MRRIVLAGIVGLSSWAFAEDGGAEVPPAAPPAPAPVVQPAPLALPPSAESIKQVMEYLENGKDRGPALLDLIPCTKVDTAKGSPTQFQCAEPVTRVAKGTTVFAWMQWYCPKDGKYEDVQLHFAHEGQDRQVVDIPVTGYGKTRSWRGFVLNKVGRWTFKVTRGSQELGWQTLDVSSN